MDGFQQGFSAKGSHAGKHFVKDGTQRKDVRSRAKDFPPHGLFGGHVARRTHDGAGLGLEIGIVIEVFGQPKVTQFEPQVAELKFSVRVGFGRWSHQNHIARL